MIGSGGDLMMPDMDGFEVVEALRANEAWWMIPGVVITAKDPTEDDRRRLNRYVDKILAKGAYTRESPLHAVRDLVTDGSYQKAVRG